MIARPSLATTALIRGVAIRECEHEALRCALASTWMEGLPVTEQTRKDCERLLDGKVSIEDLVQKILSRSTKSPS